MVRGRKAEPFPERKCKSRSKTVVLLYFVFKGKKTQKYKTALIILLWSDMKAFPTGWGNQFELRE